MFRFVTVQLISAWFVMTLYSSAVQGHPHNWVTLKSDFILDPQVRLIEIRQKWRFDAFYSSITIADIKNEFSDNNKAGFHHRAKEIITNLEGYQFFSTLKVNEVEIKLPVPKRYHLNIVEHEDQQILELEMHFVLTKAVDMENKAVSWSVFDPTYYISMLYVDLSEFVVLGGNATECSKELFIPEPSDEAIDYASTLDREQRNTEGLGDLFAEQILLNCY